VLDVTYPVDARTLRSTLFDDKSSFAKAFSKHTGRSNETHGKWRHKQGCWERDNSYTAARTALVGAHQVLETQWMTIAKHDCCTVDACALTPDVPFGETFVTKVRVCVAPADLDDADGSGCAVGARLMVSYELAWVDKPPVLKGAILSGARKGMRRSYDQYTAVLEKHLKVAPVGAAASEEAPVATTPTRPRGKLQAAVSRTATLGFVLSALRWLTRRAITVAAILTTS